MDRSHSNKNHSGLSHRLNSYHKKSLPMKDSKTNSSTRLPSLINQSNPKRLYRNKSNKLNDERSKSRSRSNSRLNRSRKKISSSSNLNRYEHIFRESNIKNKSYANKLQKEQQRIQEEHRIETYHSYLPLLFLIAYNP